MTLCVYAIASPPRPATLRASGIRGERLRVVRVGTIAAVVGGLPRRPSPTAANLRRYEAVIRTLSARLTVVIPARFGTCFVDLEQLRHALALRERPLREVVRRVRGRAQMNVRFVSGSGAARPNGERGNRDRRRAKRVSTPQSPGLESGASYLRARAEAAARERAVPGFEPVLSAVRRWVRDERVEKHAGIASVYHLIPRGAADAYRRSLEGAAVAANLRVVVTGPWAPYAFVAW